VKDKRIGIMTIVAGDKYHEIWERSRPFFEAYADKCGADLLVLENLPDHLPSPHWAKFSIHELLKKQYDRIAFIDADILIRPDSPNIFDVVPEDQFGIFNEGLFTPRSVCLYEVQKAYGIALPKWNGKDYFNTGVMVVSREHRHIFKITGPIKDIRNSFGEQTYLNMRIMSSGVKVFHLHHNYNRMSILDKVTGLTRLASFFVHYAGEGYGPTIERMDRDIKKWAEDGPAFAYKMQIFIWSLGGLGDCICAEPTIRYVRNKLYPDADIDLFSDHHYIYHHIKGITFHKQAARLDREVDAFYGLETYHTHYDAYTDFKVDFAQHTPAMLLHSVDWTSINCINRQLPLDDRTIQLEYSEEDLNGVLKHCTTPEELILIHPGRGWESKTFPVAWWQEVIDGISKAGIKVGLIGKEVSKEHGYVPVVCPQNGVDFRDKLTIPEMIALCDQSPVLISNDSAPVFIAGAADNYIILIPTCKHGDLLLPYRHGNQRYKAVTMGKKLIHDDMPVRSSDLTGWRANKIKEGHSIEEYIPDAQDVVDQAINFFSQSKRLFCLNKTKEAVNG
jgi:hypothetical protein